MVFKKFPVVSFEQGQKIKHDGLKKKLHLTGTIANLNDKKLHVLELSLLFYQNSKKSTSLLILNRIKNNFDVKKLTIMYKVHV